MHFLANCGLLFLLLVFPAFFPVLRAFVVFRSGSPSVIDQLALSGRLFPFPPPRFSRQPKDEQDDRRDDQDGKRSGQDDDDPLGDDRDHVDAALKSFGNALPKRGLNGGRFRVLLFWGVS